MGAHGGGGFSASPSSFQALKGNIDRLAKKYPLDAQNRFGTKVSEKTSEIHTATPLATAEEFWTVLSKGATVRNIHTKNGPGKIAEFSDKSHVVWRPITTSSKRIGGEHPAIELDFRTTGHGFPPRYKIHFKKGSKA